MKNINRVIVSGNLTREPEYRQTASGMGVLGFGIASNDSRKNNQTGQWEDVPNFIDCTMFGKRADSLSSMLHKGMKVCIEGRLRYSTWERDGQKRSKLEVIADEIEFMSQRQQPQQQSGHGGDAQYVQAETYETPQQGSFYDESIPF